MATPQVTPIDLERLDLRSFAGQPVAVLGLARSGLALTRFLIDQGATVTAYDGRPGDQLAGALATLGERRPRLLLGPGVDPRDVLRDQALICTSPSISSRYPTTEPHLRAALVELEALERVPVVSEVDLFLRLCPGSTIGVTGTKGKTTTSALSAAILARGDAPTVLGGNIGLPLVEQLPTLTPRHRVVLELSELQLPTLSKGTEVAVYSHVTSDHLDRHGTLEAYRAVKRRLAELLPASGVLVRNDDDAVVHGYSVASGARVVGYAQRPPAAGDLGVADGWIVARDISLVAKLGGALAETGPGGRILPLAEIPVPGDHNISNVLAAVAVGLLHGVGHDSIRAAVAAFPGVEHRLELVSSSGGVRYINDSQGTQPDAVIAAVNSFAKPLVLIAGGRSKGLPMARLATAVASRVTAAVLIGETADELATAFTAAGLSRIERASSMESAVMAARRIVEGMDGATVLLSPAAASFDMYRDYEARGAAFRAAVKKLHDAAEAGATDERDEGMSR